MTPLALPDALKRPELLQTGLFIHNAFETSTDQSAFLVHNPATGAALAQVANSQAEDVARAIDSANKALAGWRSTTARERATVLRRWYELILANADDLALLMTLEQGKPLAEAKGEIAYGASFIEWFAEQAKRVEGSVLSSPQKNRQLLVFKEAVGVCAAITPWNFPNAMITRKVSPALAAGCTVIVKPAEQTPLSALALAFLAREAGLPPGVLNILPADEHQSIAVGQLLCESKVIRKLSFTGSTPVGRILMQQCSPTVKRLSLELGGNAPFIVFADAAIEAAVDGAIASKYRNAGQTCVCTNRFYVHVSVAEKFTELFAKKVAELRVGPGWETGVQQGPLIDEAAVEKVKLHIKDAVEKGARVVTGGEPHSAGSNFFQPTVLAHANASMLVATDETFGPVAPIFTFTDEAQVIELANATDYGLAAYFYSSDIARVFRVAQALEYGMVGVNTGLITNEVAPFGGIKQSGLGREGSTLGIDEYLETKYVCIGT